MKWKPSSRLGVLVGLGAIAVVLLVDAGLTWRVVRGPLNGMTFICALLALLSLLVIAWVALRIYNLWRLDYELDRNRLAIHTAAVQQIVPLESIERVIAGGPVGPPGPTGPRRKDGVQVRMKSLTWPGCVIGQGTVQGIGLTLFYAVTPPSQQAIVVTPTLAYGISPADMDTFVQVFHASRELGPSVPVEQQSVQAPFVRWRIWHDRVAHGVLLGSVVLCALLFAMFCFRYPYLPALLPMHFDVLGRVDRIAPRNEVAVLPAIALMTWTVNGILGAVWYRRERMVSYLVWGGALIVQLLFLLALWSIVT